MNKGIIKFYFFILLIFLFNKLTLSGSLYREEKLDSDYINRWRFQELADFIYDPLKMNCWGTTNEPGGITFDPKLVKAGDIVFVRKVPDFFKKLHPKIENPYIIITHGDHQDKFKQHYISYLKDEKVIAWFGIHSSIKFHPKFFHIPIGVYQKRIIDKFKNKFKEVFFDLRKTKKTELLLINFNNYAHKDRDFLIKRFKKKSYCSVVKNPTFKSIGFNEYIRKMSNYKFTLSPPGWAVDCYRTWEALLVGSVPIVKSSALNPLYEDLPVLIIDSWDEINEEFLLKKYKEITSRKYDLDKLFMECWIRKIKTVKNEFLNNWKKGE